MSEYEKFSHRAIRVMFLVRTTAGQRGAASLEPGHLLEGLVREDQGKFATIFPGELTTMRELRPTRSFFSAEAASEILAKLIRCLQMLPLWRILRICRSLQSLDLY